jgi:hypothetical protein
MLSSKLIGNTTNTVSPPESLGSQISSQNVGECFGVVHPLTFDQILALAICDAGHYQLKPNGRKQKLPKACASFEEF